MAEEESKGIDLKGFMDQKFHGVPVPLIAAGTGAAGFVVYRLVQARRAAKTGVSSDSGTGLSGQGNASNYGAPLPGFSGLSAALGPLGGSSPTGPITGFTSSGEPVFANNQVPAPSAPVPDMISTAPAQPDIAISPPAPVVSAQPAPNAFSIGQLVNPRSGESIVSSVFSPVYGWLNLTNKGGIYTSGGSQSIGSLQNSGSYLGYAATTPNPAAETAAHGQFGEGGLSLLPGGGYQLVNTHGETYRFGS